MFKINIFYLFEARNLEHLINHQSISGKEKKKYMFWHRKSIIIKSITNYAFYTHVTHSYRLVYN